MALEDARLLLLLARVEVRDPLQHVVGCPHLNKGILTDQPVALHVLAALDERRVELALHLEWQPERLFDLLRLIEIRLEWLDHGAGRGHLQDLQVKLGGV